jgi:hypothetical protein
VLAALLFLAIVIPVAVEALHIANQAGQVADRRNTAGRICERALNEILVTGAWQSTAQGASVQEGPHTYTWTAQASQWDQDSLQLVTVQVKFTVQGREYEVHLSTLADPNATTGTTSGLTTTGIR